MTEENKIAEKKNMSAPAWSEIKLQTFDEILKEFDEQKPARMFIPVFALEEDVSVKIYAPGEEKEEPDRKEKRRQKKEQRQQLEEQHKQQKLLLQQQKEEKLLQTAEADRLKKEKKAQQKADKKRFAALEREQRQKQRLDKKEISSAAKQQKKKFKAERKAAMQPYSHNGMATVCVFAVIVLFIVILNIAMPKADFSAAENRSLAKLPTLSISAIKSGSFSEDFEAYLTDRFAFRDGIVAFRTLLSSVFGSNEHNGVYSGKNGRKFQKQTAYNDSKIKNTVSAIKKFSTSSKIKNQMMMLVPDSSYILKDELPLFLSADNQGKQIEKIYSLLPEKIKATDVTADFLACKDRDSLYYRTDHHWTTAGAKRAFDLLAKSWKLNTKNVKYKTYTVSNDFFGTLSPDSSGTPDSIEICVPSDSIGTYVVANKALKTKSTTLFDSSKLENKNQYEVFLGGNYSLITVSTVNRNDKSLLIFKDSYANCLIPMLTPYFEKIVIIDARYFTSDIKNVLSEEKFTHLLYLYSLNTFLSDTSLSEILN